MTTRRNDSAYPLVRLSGVEEGLTKREQFASMAMQGLLSSDRIQDSVNKVTTTKGASFDTFGEMAVRLADALIAALNKETT